MRVLIVGGAGYVGAMVRGRLEGEFDCSYYDLVAVAGAEGRSFVGDVGDDDLVREAVAGQDAIVYMPLGGKKSDRTCTAVGPAFGVNVAGLYRFMEYGLSDRCRRFVYVSSMSVFFPHMELGRLDEGMVANSWTPYGISKRLGEYVCAAGAEQYPEATVPKQHHAAKS